MVIIDKLGIPLKKALYFVIFLLFILIVVLIGISYKKSISAEKAEILYKQKASKALSDEKLYNTEITEIITSPNIISMRELYNELYKDKIFFQAMGWFQNEVVCNVNICNVRYIKSEDRLFEYITLKKGNESYLPIFNENELTYQDVNYPIKMDANVIFSDKLSDLKICTEFISNAYMFKSLLKYSLKTTFDIAIPSDVFSYSSSYEWAVHSALKKADIVFETSDMFILDLLQEYYQNDLIQFESMHLKDEKLNIKFTYYCI